MKSVTNRIVKDSGRTGRVQKQKGGSREDIRGVLPAWYLVMAVEVNQTCVQHPTYDQVNMMPNTKTLSM